jgi:subtilisin family serine protease
MKSFARSGRQFGRNQCSNKSSFRPAVSLALTFVLAVSLIGGWAGATRAEAAINSAVIDPALASAMRQGAGPFQVIVTFRGESAPGLAEVAALGLSGVGRAVTFQALPMAGAVATSQQISALAARPEVRSIWLNRRLEYDNAEATVLTGVDRAREDAEFTAKNGSLPVNGRGVTVLVNDSGVDGTHPDLVNNVDGNVAAQGGFLTEVTGGIVPATYVEGLDNTDVGGGHGTHVAGILAGTGAGAGDQKYEGVAPGARIVGFSSGAGLFLLNVLGGFDYALKNRERHNIRVVTNSWGDTGDVGTDFNPDDPTNVATKLLNDRGVVIVFSAGNSGPNSGTITGNFKKAPWVICVASSDKKRVLANSSSRGVKDKVVTVRGSDGQLYVSEDRPTVTAPGVRIVSARAAGSSLSPLSAANDATGIAPENLAYYTTLSGTSMAAPHVAGIVSLMLDANPALTPAVIKSIIQDTADLMPTYEAWQVGAGFVNAYDAVASSFDVKLRKPKCNQKNPCTGARTTVAVIDSGINPYHGFFHAGGEPYAAQAPSAVTPEVLAAFGIDAAHQIQLTRTGDPAADYAADKARVWDQIKQGELYWFKGTNIIATTFDPGTRPILPDDSADTHGVGTTAAVVRANPESVILFVEGITDASETFAFTHPEVDIVTTSYGFPGSLPLPFHLKNSYTGVVKNGKLHFGAADNSPALSPPDGTSGPWWSIGIAGFQEATTGTNPADPGSEGRQIVSGSLPDFVADFTQVLPYCDTCQTGGMSRASGTSFATPRSAGTMSKILLEARRALRHAGGIRRLADGTAVMVQGADRVITNWQLRRALESGAYYPSVYQFTPTTTGTYNITSVPVLDPAPWAQVGWGAITPDPAHQVIEQTLAHLAIRGEITRYKDYAACQFMSAQIRARHLYWDNVAIESESWMQGGSDPFIYCGQ